MPDRSEAPPSIGFVLLPNFTLTAFAGLMDVLRLAADEGDRSQPVRLRWTLVAPTLEPVRASCGVEVQPWETFGDPARFDYVVVCGGLLRRPHGVDAQIEGFLRRAAASGAIVVGLCTGSFMMAQAGLLTDRRACVSWFHLRDFQEEFPEITPVAMDLFVVDGAMVTCAGGTGAVDVGAWIVERHFGAPAARKALHILLVDAARPGSGPQPQPALTDGVDDPRVRRAVLLLEERLDRPLSTATLARAVGLSRRQLERLFNDQTGMGPAAFLAGLRLRHADWLIRTSQLSMTDIAGVCGFSDAAHLSRRYKALFGRPPSQARGSAPGFAPGERRPYPSVPA